MNDSLNIPRSLLAAVMATTFAAAPALAQPDDPRNRQDHTGSTPNHADNQAEPRDADRGYLDSRADVGVDPHDMDSDQPLDDTWITTKVKTALMADDDVGSLEIDV